AEAVVGQHDVVLRPELVAPERGTDRQREPRAREGRPEAVLLAREVVAGRDRVAARVDADEDQAQARPQQAGQRLEGRLYPPPPAGGCAGARRSVAATANRAPAPRPGSAAARPANASRARPGSASAAPPRA